MIKILLLPGNITSQELMMMNITSTCISKVAQWVNPAMVLFMSLGGQAEGLVTKSQTAGRDLLVSLATLNHAFISKASQSYQKVQGREFHPFHNTLFNFQYKIVKR